MFLIFLMAGWSQSATKACTASSRQSTLIIDLLGKHDHRVKSTKLSDLLSWIHSSSWASRPFRSSSTFLLIFKPFKLVGQPPFLWNVSWGLAPLVYLHSPKPPKQAYTPFYIVVVSLNPLTYCAQHHGNQKCLPQILHHRYSFSHPPPSPKYWLYLWNEKY